MSDQREPERRAPVDVLTPAEVRDIVGAMVEGNVEEGIEVTYDRAAGKLHFRVLVQEPPDPPTEPAAPSFTSGPDLVHVTEPDGRHLLQVRWGQAGTEPIVPAVNWILELR